jgi:outer membrane lipase/esterase
MNKSLIKSGIFCFGLLVAGWCEAASFSEAIVFGDSLSDSGNYFTQFGGMSMQPYETENVPSAPYAIGGHHFTNGATWVEQLTKELHIPNSGSPSEVSPGLFRNYAVGRSRARAVLLDGVFSEVNLTTQVDSFLADEDDQAPGAALYIIWIGSNDVADALFAPNPAEIMGAALLNTFTQIQRLYAHGARHFLILNMPDFALTPRVLDVVSVYPVPVQEFLLQNISLASVGYNQALAGNLAFMQSVLPDMDVISLDVFSVLNDIVANPELYGLEIVDEACIIPDTQGQAYCSNWGRYLFWDAQHPTREGHSIIAEQAEMEIESH